MAIPSDAAITEILNSSKTIAVVGLSAKPYRASFGVSETLLESGYRVIPVTPAVPAVLGEVAVPALAQLPQVLGAGGRVDIVDVFRRPVHVAGLVDGCIRLKLPALWLQKGVIDEVAAARAVQAGIFMVMDRCLYKERAALR